MRTLLGDLLLLLVLMLLLLLLLLVRSRVMLRWRQGRWWQVGAELWLLVLLLLVVWRRE